MKQTRPRKSVVLTNSGKLSLFFTGVGSAFTKRQYQTNFLIVKGKDHVMVDCGTRTPRALHELGVNLRDLRNFFITHTHADHIGGLEEIMITNRYFYKVRPTAIITPELQRILWDCGLRAGTAHNERIDGRPLDFSDMWNIIRPEWLGSYGRETWNVDIGTINLKLFRTKHIPDSAESWMDSLTSYGLIIDERVMYSGDTRFDPDLLTNFVDRFDIDTIFHDCQFFTAGIHASLEELSGLPTGVKERMILVHYGDDWEKFRSRIREKGFRGLGKSRCLYELEG